MVKTIYSIDARVYKVCSQEYIKCVIKSIYSHDIRVSILLNIHFSASESSTHTFDYQHIAFSQKKNCCGHRRHLRRMEDGLAPWMGRNIRSGKFTQHKAIVPKPRLPLPADRISPNALLPRRVKTAISHFSLSLPTKPT